MGMGLNCYYVHKFILATIKVRPLFTKKDCFFAQGGRERCYRKKAATDGRMADFLPHVTFSVFDL